MSIDREKLLSISVKKASKEADARDRTLAKDLDAYKRLRRDGLQPPRIDGSARLERDAVSALEVQTGVVQSNLPAKKRRKLAENLAEMEFKPR